MIVERASGVRNESGARVDERECSGESALV